MCPEGSRSPPLLHKAGHQLTLRCLGGYFFAPPFRGVRKSCVPPAPGNTGKMTSSVCYNLHSFLPLPCSSRKDHSNCKPYVSNFKNSSLLVVVRLLERGIAETQPAASCRGPAVQEGSPTSQPLLSQPAEGLDHPLSSASLTFPGAGLSGSRSPEKNPRTQSWVSHSLGSRQGHPDPLL